MNGSRLDALLLMLEDQPEDPFLHYALATEYRRLGNGTQTLFEYLKTLEIDPLYIGVYYHLASFYLEMGNQDEAKKIYLKGMELASEKGDKHAFAELKAAFDDFVDMEEDE